MYNDKKPVIIGIAGGSGSGKTTIARKIYNQLKENDHILIMTQDSYYKNNDNLSLEERKKINYDHPDAFDSNLLVSQLKDLLKYKAIEMPVYDFSNHTRSKKTIHTDPADFILLEGILVLNDTKLRNLMNIKLFVDTDDDIRFIRRLLRDTKKRNRSVDSVVNQYLSTVKPMYNQFIEPSKRYADIIIPEGGENNVAIDMVTTKIRSVLNQ